MTLLGTIKNGVVVFPDGLPENLAEGTPVEVRPIKVGGPRAQVPAEGRGSKERREALLRLIGICKSEHPPSDEEVGKILEEARMKKHG